MQFCLKTFPLEAFLLSHFPHQILSGKGVGGERAAKASRRNAPSKSRNRMEIKPHCSAFFGLNYQPAKERREQGSGGKKTRTVVRHLARPCPTPIPGEGAELGLGPLDQASSEGVWWSPEAGREGRNCFPFGPPHPHLRSQGPSKQDGGGGREDRVRAQALALDQPDQLGDGALLQEGPHKPWVSHGQRGRKIPRKSCREYFSWKVCFG